MKALSLISAGLMLFAAPALGAQMTLNLTSDEASSSTTMLSIDASSSEASDGDMSMSMPDESSSDEPSGPTEPALPSKDALGKFVSACTDISGGDPKAYDRATAAGWQPDEAADTGPYRRIYSGSQDVAGYGSVTIWGSVDTYPTQSLGYCRVDFGDYDNLIDFADMSGLNGLSGKVTDKGEGNVFGAWESADKKLLVIADRTDGQVEIEFNLLLGDTPN